MQADRKNNSIKSSPFLIVFENVLLLVILSLMVLRATYIENPHIEQIQTKFFLTSEIVSLLMSTILLSCFLLWLLISILTNRLRWRKTYLGPAVGLFVLAGIIGFFAASNKRAAVTDLVFLSAPMFTAMFLVQLFSTKSKTHIAILLMLAVAVTMTAQCVDQLVDSNEVLIQEYEQDPLQQLQMQNIEPDSLEHWMYEHRLYSKDIRGFLTTGNSAASFLLLSVFMGLGLCIEAFRERKQPETLAAFVCYVLAVLLALGGLFMTRSKGGLGAFVFAVLLLVLLTVFGKPLWKYRIAIGVLLLIAIVAAAIGIINYGCEHERLPGGNSMLVRWQYWQSTARMIGDHIWTGAGGGNFRFLYPLYKNTAASETVQDPHNFILSLFSQYGPLGLLAFFMAVLWPIWKCFQQRFGETSLLASDIQRTNKRLWIGLLGASVCMLLFVRPFLVDTDFLYQDASVRSAAYVVLYLFPASIFVVAFGLLSAVGTGDISIQKTGHYLTLSLVCGVLAVLFHNLVDFAIFETGVWNSFWLCIAILIAYGQNNSLQNNEPIRLCVPSRLFIFLILVALTTGYFAIVLMPPVKANRLFRQAVVSRRPQFEYIDKAIAVDRLSPDTAYNAARMFVQMYTQQRTLTKDPSLLQKASDYADIAQQRNSDSFKPYRLKARIALMLAGQAESDQKAEHFQVAYEMFLKAHDRYPGSDLIEYDLGQTAEQLGRLGAALSHYRKAVEIEQAYQAQFKVMYPDRRPVISRLGNTAYTIAKDKIEMLEKKLSSPQDE